MDQEFNRPFEQVSLMALEKTLGLEGGEELFADLLENLPVAVFLKDANDGFRIKLWNRAAERIFEVPRESILGRATHDLWPAHDADQYLADDERVMQAGAHVDIEETTPTRSRGTIHLRTRKIPLRGRNRGRPFAYLLAICDDISEQKAAQCAIVQSAKMASLGEMAGGIAHEINNPLSVILAMSEVLRMRLAADQLTREELDSQLGRLEETALRISKIVKGLLAFSRSEPSDTMEIVRARTIVEEATGLCSERFRVKGVDLRVECATEQTLECRPLQISQILINLLANAFDAVDGAEERWVRLYVEAAHGRVRFTVTDSGPGPLPSVADKIMLPFFTTKGVGEGTGLGLSISKGLAESHSGTLAFDAGAVPTRFVLELPERQPREG